VISRSPTITTPHQDRAKNSIAGLVAPALILAYVWLVAVAQLRLEWTVNAQYHYGWAVLCLVPYLFVRKWPARPIAEPLHPAQIRVLTCVSLVLALFLFPVRLVQEANPDWRLVSWAVAFLAVGFSFVTLCLFGGRSWVKHFAFPVLFLLTAVPWPTLLEKALIQGLTRANVAATLELLSWCGIPALQHGNVIEVSTGLVGIDEACSGIRSFQATFMVSLFLGEFYRLRPRSRLLLCISGVALALVCNLGRTFLLTWVAARNGLSAISTWHDPAGVTILLICLFGLWAIGRRFRSQSVSAQVIAAEIAPANFIGIRALKRSLIVIASWFLLVEIASELWYRSHEWQLPPTVDWSVRLPETEHGFRKLPIPDETRKILRYNEATSAAWQELDGTRWLIAYFHWLPGRAAPTLARNHTPEVCLPAAGRNLIGQAPMKIYSAGLVDLPFRVFTYEGQSGLVHVFYCLWNDRSGDRDLASSFLTVSKRLADVRAGKRNLGQRVLHVGISGTTDRNEAERVFQAKLPSIIAVDSRR